MRSVGLPGLRLGEMVILLTLGSCWRRRCSPRRVFPIVSLLGNSWRRRSLLKNFSDIRFGTDLHVPLFTLCAGIIGTHEDFHTRLRVAIEPSIGFVSDICAELIPFNHPGQVSVCGIILRAIRSEEHTSE